MGVPGRDIPGLGIRNCVVPQRPGCSRSWALVIRADAQTRGREGTLLTLKALGHNLDIGRERVTAVAARSAETPYSRRFGCLCSYVGAPTIPQVEHVFGYARSDGED